MLKALLGAKGQVTRAKAKIMKTANLSVSAINNSAFTPIDYSTAARASVKPKAVSKHFADRLAAEQVQVEAEMKRLVAKIGKNQSTTC